MKAEFRFYPVLKISFLILLLLTGCERERLPKVTTAQISDIEPNSAISGGNVTHDGNADVVVKGVCWGTKKSPSIEGSGNRTQDGFGSGAFTSTITDLEPNTLYYVRAYATNVMGTAYGSQLTFTTDQVSVATLTTNLVSSITRTSAVSGGNITSSGGSMIIQRGVCWSEDPNPDIEDSLTEDGTGTGSFTSNITGLTGNKKYYVRAYATNSQGTAYGQETSFTTSPVLPSVTTSSPSPTSISTATGGGNVTNDGGSPILSRGICWHTSVNPTITNSRTIDGTGTGSFTSLMTGLAENTLYHVRAYAVNSEGVAYGQDLTFTTDPSTVQDYNGNVYNVIRIGTQLWIKENLRTTRFNNGTSIPLVTGSSSWANLTTPGYCLYNNSEANGDIYGALYNWFAVDAGNLCPAGWHVPTDDECILLENFLGGASPAGGKLKEEGTAHWSDPNTSATDEWGFTALPGGNRTAAGQFENIGDYGTWWTSSDYSSTEAWARRLQYDSEKAFRNFTNMKIGKSIRCLKN